MNEINCILMPVYSIYILPAVNFRQAPPFDKTANTRYKSTPKVHKFVIFYITVFFTYCIHIVILHNFNFLEKNFKYNSISILFQFNFNLLFKLAFIKIVPFLSFNEFVYFAAKLTVAEYNTSLLTII